MTAKLHLLKSAEIAPRTFAEYRSTTDRLVRVLGKERLVDDLAANDFERLRADIAETRGPVALGNEVQRVRSIFKLAYDNGLIDKPIRYGQGFNKPSRKVLRKAKAANGNRMFEAAEIRKMLGAAPQPLRAMILLGVNCGFGNADCGTLPLRAVDLDAGWINYVRSKTGIERRCPFWAETVESLREAIAERPTPKDKRHADLVFVTKYGGPWAKDTPDSPVTKETRKLLDKLGLHRPGLGFYALRHSFRTAAAESRDFRAIDLIMGHADNSMAGHYRERIDDTRLQAVVDHVHQWLFESDRPTPKPQRGFPIRASPPPLGSRPKPRPLGVVDYSSGKHKIDATSSKKWPLPAYVCQRFMRGLTFAGRAVVGGEAARL